MPLQSTLQLPPTGKPGETAESRDNKFGGGVYSAVSTLEPRQQSWDKSTYAVTHDCVVPSDYKPPDRRGVMVVKDKLAASRRRTAGEHIVNQSMYESTFANSREQVEGLLSLSDEEVKAAFDSADTLGSGTITFADLENLVNSLNGGSAALWVHGKFNRAFERFQTRPIAWVDFQVAFHSAMQSIESEVASTTASQPLWAQLSRQPPKPYKSVQIMRSSYQVDMALDEAANKDLFAGTTKDCQHIPGYSGYIPRVKRHERVIEHGTGTQRPQQTDLRLYSKQSVLNYTGHIPQTALHDRERLTGCDPRTTSGASALGMML